MGHTYIFVDQMGLDEMGINHVHYNMTHMKASAFAEIFCHHCWLHKRRDSSPGDIVIACTWSNLTNIMHMCT